MTHVAHDPFRAHSAVDGPASPQVPENAKEVVQWIQRDGLSDEDRKARAEAAWAVELDRPGKPRATVQTAVQEATGTGPAPEPKAKATPAKKPAAKKASAKRKAPAKKAAAKKAPAAKK